MPRSMSSIDPTDASAYGSRAGIGSASAARPGGAGKGSAKYWASLRDETIGDLHDAERICGHAVIGDHALAHPNVAAAQDPADGEVAFGRVPAALRLDL